MYITTNKLMIMKTLFLLLSISILASCQAKDHPRSENIMEQKNILELVKHNDIEGVKQALEKGADVNTKDNNKRNLLLLATNNKLVEMAKLLVAKGADVNMQADNMDSPFLYAGASGQTELVRLYLANGARFDIFNRYNGTALIPACERGHVETVRLLVNTPGYPVNHVNRLGWTALTEAVVLGDGTKNYQEIVQLLKDGGADLLIPDNEGITALQHARNKGFSEIVKILS